MDVLVTGGTGFIGSHSVAELDRSGHRIRLMVRNPAAVPAVLRPLGVEPDDIEVVTGDVTDEAAVARAIAGCDAVLHAASVFSFDSRQHRQLNAVNVRGTELVLGAAARAGLDPIVHVSSFVALLPTRGRPLDPQAPVGRPREAYMASKAASERIARRHQEQGASVTITYPMATLGPDDPRLGDGLARVRNVLLGLMPVWPLGGYPVGDVRDVARLHSDVMRPGQGARRLLAPGTNLSTRGYLRLLRQVTGRSLPTVFLPAAAVLPVGLAVQAAQRVMPWHIPAEYGAIYACLCDPRLPGPCAPPTHPVEQTMADSVRWLYSSGRLGRRYAGLAAGHD